MISVYQIKPKFQQLLKPLLGVFHKVGITANGITWMAILLSTAIGVLFWFFPNGHMLWIFAVGLLVRMALNALDGMMAKTYGMTSVSGEMLNELGDVFSDAGTILSFDQADRCEFLVGVVVHFSFSTE